MIVESRLTIVPFGGERGEATEDENQCDHHQGKPSEIWLEGRFVRQTTSRDALNSHASL